MSGLLYQLEEERDRTIVQYMQDRLQSALDAYGPMCSECDLAMSKHQSYPRSIITKDGELRLSVPKFQCGRMSSGMELLGSVLKKTREKAIELAAMGLSYAHCSDSQRVR